MKGIFLKEGSAEVRYIDEHVGKAVFADRDYKPGESVFIEAPLVSHRIVAQERNEDGTEDEEDQHQVIPFLIYVTSLNNSSWFVPLFKEFATRRLQLLSKITNL